MRHKSISTSMDKDKTRDVAIYVNSRRLGRCYHVSCNSEKKIRKTRRQHDVSKPKQQHVLDLPSNLPGLVAPPSCLGYFVLAGVVSWTKGPSCLSQTTTVDLL